MAQGPRPSASRPTGSASPSCRACRHFFITYQPQLPYGCAFFGFESRRLPSVEVLESSGSACRAFEPRPAPGRGRT